MKPIEINEEQKEKLLEMCKVLFPKYPEIFITEFESDDLNIFMFSKNSIKYWKKELKEDFDIDYISLYEADVKIHWFEFCMTHLAKKLLYLLYVPKNANSEEGYQIGMEKFSNNALYYPKIHLVDYLYLEFKKL